MRGDLGVLAALVSILWVLMEGALAHRNGMLTAYQMRQKYPQHPQGLPFIGHFGMWGDLFIITSLVGLIVALYSEQWSLTQMLVMAGIGMALSIAMHCVYVMTPFPDSLAWKGGISAAGWMHVLYMGIVFAVVGLLFFCTTNVSPPFLVFVSVLLTVHVAIGNHIVLGWLNETHHWSWCPDFIHKPDPWIAISATCVVLSILTGWAVDVQAGISVVTICAAIALLVYMYVTKTLSSGSRWGF